MFCVVLYLPIIPSVLTIPTIEELDDVCEVHVVLQDDVPVNFHQGKCNEEDVVRRGDVSCSPDGLPHRENIIIYKFYVQEKGELGVSWSQVWFLKSSITERCNSAPQRMSK